MLLFLFPRNFGAARDFRRLVDLVIGLMMKLSSRRRTTVVAWRSETLTCVSYRAG